MPSSRFAFAVCLFSAIFASAQSPRASLSNAGDQSREFVLNGTIVGAEGTPVPAGVVVTLRCNEQSRAHGNTDTKGNFSLSLFFPGDAGPAAFDTSSARLTIDDPRAQPRLQSCDLRVEADGYMPNSFPLAAIAGDDSPVQLGQLVLQRSRKRDADNVASATVSANTLAASPKARADFEQGLHDEQKGDMQAARQKFDQALSADGHFGAAWFKLGQVNEKENKLEDARFCFLQSLADDPNSPQINVALANASK